MRIDHIVDSLYQQVRNLHKTVETSCGPQGMIRLAWLEYCLHCTCFTATLELTIASPLPEILRAFLTQFSSAQDLPDHNPPSPLRMLKGKR
jgi:hypothetical protein